MQFPVGQSEFSHRVLYSGHKVFMMAVFVALAIWGARIARQTSAFSWVHLGIAIAGTVLIIGSVALLKKYTGVECPWSVDIFGGTVPYRSLEELFASALLGQFGQGHCFPAGHSTGGLFLLAWSVAFAEYSKSISTLLWILALILGIVMGVLRIAQGAHFLSHVVWSIWLSIFISYVLSYVLRVVSKANGSAVKKLV